MRLFPRFFPKTIQKIIDERKPRYYDKDGKLIDKYAVLPAVEPVPYNIPDRIEPLYNFNADTTATIQIGDKMSKEQDKVKVEQPQKDVITGYCVKCKEKREILNPVVENKTTSRGVKRMATGKCKECNTNMGVILKKEA